MVEPSDSQIPPNDSDSIRNALLTVSSELEYEKNHAAFLGYKVTEIETNILLLEPDSSNRLWWWWLIKRSHGVLARRIMPEPRMGSDRYDVLDFINEVNCVCETIALTLQLDGQSRPLITAHGFLEGQYSRSNFTIFMDRINDELTDAFNQPNINSAWSKIKQENA